eukprot:scaffold297942_cov33-Tisochrysis_lutea.AAC.3
MREEASQRPQEAVCRPHTWDQRPAVAAAVVPLGWPRFSAIPSARHHDSHAQASISDAVVHRSLARMSEHVRIGLGSDGKCELRQPRGLNERERPTTNSCCSAIAMTSTSYRSRSTCHDGKRAMVPLPIATFTSRLL